MDINNPEVTEEKPEEVPEVQATEQTPEQAQEVTQSAETVDVDPLRVEVKPFQLPEAKEVTEPTEAEIIARFKDKPEVLLQALSEFGHIDEWTKGLLEYKKSTGDVRPYLEVYATDYDKVSDEQIVRHKMKEQYAALSLSPEEVEALVEADLAQKLPFAEEGDEEAERALNLARVRLKAEAQQHRSLLKAEQAKFRAPEPTLREETPEPTREQVIAHARSIVLKDPQVQGFYKDKRLQFGDPQNPYNFEVSDPESIIQTVYDGDKWAYVVAQKDENGQVVKDENGHPVPDQRLLAEIAAFAEHRDKIVNGLIAFGEARGKKKVIDESEHIPDTRTHAGGEPDDMWTQLHRKLKQS